MCRLYGGAVSPDSALAYIDRMETAFVFALPVSYVYFALSLEECLRFGISLAVFRRRRWMRRLSAHAD